LAKQEPDGTTAVNSHERFDSSNNLLANKNLPPATVRRLKRCNHIMGVAQRLPMDGLFDRHRTPRYVLGHVKPLTCSRTDEAVIRGGARNIERGSRTYQM
jgi:hypothetical protein